MALVHFVFNPITFEINCDIIDSNSSNIPSECIPAKLFNCPGLCGKCRENQAAHSGTDLQVPCERCRKTICEACQQFLTWTNQKRDYILTTLLNSDLMCGKCDDEGFCSHLIDTYDKKILNNLRYTCQQIRAGYDDLEPEE